MTIAITAPQKFAFQDLVCIETMLRFSAHADATLFIEPDGGEDAELTFHVEGRSVRCEIQVKGAGGAVTLADVASCLAHAPPRRAEDTLLERILADPESMALLVMSGRADDASSVYLGDRGWRGESRPRSKINAADAKTMSEAFALANVGGSEGGALSLKRQAHNEAFSKSVDPAALREALGRVVIFDQVDDAGLEASCGEYLRKDHGVPSDRIAAVLLELRAAVAKAKADRTDAFPLVRSVLDRHSPPTIRPRGYVERGDEAGLVEDLSRDNVLLLSGTPRVGKTFAARRVAAEFMPLGYDVREFTEVEAAERFLLEPGPALRLALLDDPLGGSQVSPQATGSLARLAGLIGRVGPQRKLLVAQGLEPLLATARTASLDRTLSGGRRWRDMSGLQPVFLVGLWRSLASTFAIETQLRERVADELGKGTLQLEPGCLEYLAANAGRLSASPAAEEIVRLAREDAAQLGRMLADEGLEGLAVCLSVATSPQEPIALESLAYVRGSGGSGLPSKRTSLGTITQFAGPPIAESPAPAYDERPELAIADQNGLDALERRRLIIIDAKPNVGFSHPFYRAAAESLLIAPTYHLARSIGPALERGLFCLSPLTSRATARNLEWIFDRLEGRPAERETLVAHAIEGLHSLFPATRDLCFRFLVRRLSELRDEQKEDLPGWIKSVSSIALEDLEWTDGEAHLPYGMRSTNQFERLFRSVRRDDVAEDLAALDAPDGAIAPDRAAVVLRHLDDEPGAMTPTMAGRLLSYDEAVLRAAAAMIWLRHPRDNDHDLLGRIFADDHPRCVISALTGVIRGWGSCDPGRRARLLDGLAALASNVAAAAAMLDKLVLFDRVEHTGKQPPWPIFERLMPIVMAVLPQNAAFVDARLFSVSRTALGEMAAPSLVALCDGWIEWLERNARVGSLPSEFSLGVSEILLQATAKEPERRQSRVARLLAFAGTGAKMRFMADLVDHWDLLCAEERATVCERLRSGHSDDRWLQAVALTRSEVPDEIVELLLPNGLDLSQPPEKLIDAVPPALIEAAVHVYCGQPQPLWWLGVHHTGRETWEPVVEALARRPDHPLFELAFDDIASTGDGDRVARIIADLGAPSADRVLDILLRFKVGCTGYFMPEAWAILLRLAADPEEYGRWLDRMAAASPAILNDLSDLAMWLTNEDDFRGLLERLKSDFAPLEMTRAAFQPMQGFDISDLQEKLIPLLERLVSERPPLLFGTCDLLVGWLERASVDMSGVIAALRHRRDAIFSAREEIKASMAKPDPVLVGWIKP